MRQGRKRPLPDDFVEMCNRLKYRHLVTRHYRCGETAISRWSSEAGFNFANRKEMPADFRDNAVNMTIKQLTELYQVAYVTVKRWFKEADLKPLMRDGAPVPNDFSEMAPTMVVSELCDHYNTTRNIVLRWLRITGATPKPFDHAEHTKRVWAEMREAGRCQTKVVKPFASATDDLRQLTKYDLAADVIRRLCPVNRCNERGVYDANGKYWRVGWSILTPEELLARAEKKRSAA